MKKTVRIFVVLAVLAMALTGLSLAQNPNYRLVANIPFDFNVGNQHLPAGPYLFVVDYDSPVVTVRNTSTGQAEMLLTIRGEGEGTGNPVVEFDVIAGTHRLADLKTANRGVNFPESKEQVALARRGGSVAIVATLR